MRSAAGPLMLVAALILTTACSDSDDPAPASNRRCAVVDAGDISELVDTAVTLQKAGAAPAVCRFSDSEEAVDVRIEVGGPVEAGQPKLLLDDPGQIRGLGSEAWWSTTNTPLEVRVLVRQVGALLTIDLTAPDLKPGEKRAAAVGIAEKAVARLPKVALPKPGGPRGAKACAPFKDPAVEVALGGAPVLTPTNPPGSCSLVLEARGLTVVVNVLVDKRATPQMLSDIVKGAPEAAPAAVGGLLGWWIEAPGGDASGGQLDVLDGQRLLQIAVLGSELEPGTALTMATAVGKVALA